MRVSLATLAAAALLCGCRKRSEPILVAGGDIERGRAEIEAYGCGACHVIPGVSGARGMVGPPLGGFARRAFIAGRAPNDVQALVRWIMLPQSLEPGTAMPTLGVSEPEARDIAAYLYTLR